MRYFLSFIFPLFIFCCTEKPNPEEAKKPTPEGEMTTETIKHYTENTENNIPDNDDMPEVIKRFPNFNNGTYTHKDSIEYYLKKGGIVSEDGETPIFFEFVINTNEFSYLTPCEYNKLGTYNFVIDLNKEATEYYNTDRPLLAHNYQEPTLYVIEKMIIKKEGAEIDLKVRYLPTKQGQYTYDISQPQNHVKIYLDEQSIVLKDRFDTNPRTFLLQDLIYMLDEESCEDNY